MTDNINDILDATLDDLEDLPEFKPFPAGAHRVLVTTTIKEINGKQAVELSMKHLETLELAEPTKDTPPKEGDESSVAFMLDNEFGRGKLKNALRPLTAALGTSTNRETIEAAKDVECLVVTSVRKDKQDPTRLYANINELQVV